ncbi:MAG: hypothetical protein GX096_02550 [Clostridiales bacterium]|nr:hypothetical protein [Clostridiales bacterium]
MERQTFAICMSIDKVKGEKIEIGIQAPESATSSGLGAAQGYAIITAEGADFEEALRILATTTPYPLNFCQLRLCLIGYELAATTELHGLLRGLERLPTIRTSSFVMVAIGSALDVMSAQKPDFGMRMSTHLNLLFERLRDENMLPYSTIASVVRELADHRRDPLLCLAAINPKKPEEKQQNQNQDAGGSGGGESGGSGGESGGGSGSTGEGASSAFATQVEGGDGTTSGELSESSDDSGTSSAFAVGEPWNDLQLPSNLIAGLTPKTSSNPVEYLGAAVVNNGRVAGYLDARETQLTLETLAKAELSVAMDGDKIQLQIFVESGTELESESDKLKLIMERLQLMGCDALGFGGICAQAFYLDTDLIKYDFKHKYQEAEVVIAPM